MDPFLLMRNIFCEHVAVSLARHMIVTFGTPANISRNAHTTAEAVYKVTTGLDQHALLLAKIHLGRTNSLACRLTYTLD